MTTRIQRSWLAWGLFAITLPVAVGIVTLATLNGPNTEGWGGYILFGLMSIAYAGVGALIASRRSHPIGWLFCGIGFAFGLGNLMEQYALYTTVTAPESLPIFVIGFPLGVLVWAFATTSLIFVFLLFPTGHLVSNRWTWVSRTAILSSAVWAVTFMLRAADPGALVQNPIAVRSLHTPLLVIFGIAVTISLSTAVIAIVGLVIRFRRSEGVERQQIKWLAFVGVSAAAIFVIGMPVQFLIGSESLASNVLWNAFFSLLMFGIPLSVGFAILRYRLYDIDRIISRTFSYAIVTAILGGVFALIVLVPALLVGSSGSGVPDLVIAAATVVVAMLFRPVRRRVQGAIDRRFNRARYDASRTIEGFSARLREEIDIDTLAAELQGVVARTMQPTHVSLWMRKT